MTNNRNIGNSPVTSIAFKTPAVNKNCPNVDNFLYDPSNCDVGYW
jgi:hypothetical protein